MSKPRKLHFRFPRKRRAKYERPRVAAVGNLNDILAMTCGCFGGERHGHS